MGKKIRVSITDKYDWIIKWCGKVVLEILNAEFGIKQPANFKLIEKDGRRLSSVFLTLYKEGLINLDGEYSLEKVIEKMRTLEVSAPRFREFYPSKTLNDIYAVYVPLDKIYSEGLIYIYLHREDYDIKPVEHVNFIPTNSNTFNSNTYTALKIYPKNKIKELYEAILNNSIYCLCMKNLNEVLTLTFNREFKSFVKSEDLKYRERDILISYEKENFDSETINERLAMSRKQLEFIKGYIKELEFLSDLMKEKDFNNKLWEGMKKYTRAEAPLWVCGNDEKLKKLGEMILNYKENI